MRSIGYPGRLSLMSAVTSFLNCCPGCHGSHCILWHHKGTISSQSGVQQGDPLGPMLFALILQTLVSSIEADDECFDLSLNLWYLDDGMLAGEKSAVVRALHLTEELGPHLAKASHQSFQT